MKIIIIAIIIITIMLKIIIIMKIIIITTIKIKIIIMLKKIVIKIIINIKIWNERIKKQLIIEFMSFLLYLEYNQAF